MPHSQQHVTWRPVAHRHVSLTTVAAVALLVVGAYLRLAHLELAEFKFDEATAVLMARDLVEGRRLPLAGLGTSVAGLESGPIFIYLTALPISVTPDPVVATGFVGLLNVLALAITYVLTKREFGVPTALATLALYAVGSWAVLFSRKLWSNEVMPLFSAILAWALVTAVADGRQRGMLIAAMSLGILVNLHPTGLLFAPLVAIAFLLRPSLLWTRATAGGAIVLLGVSTPYLVYQVQNGFPAASALFRFGSGVDGLDPRPFEHVATLVGPTAWRILAGPLRPEFDAATLPTTGIGPITTICLALGVAVAVAHVVAIPKRIALVDPSIALPRARPAAWRARVLLIAWLVVPLLAATPRLLPVEIHYFIPILPATFVFAGLGAVAPFAALRRLELPRVVRGSATLAPVVILGWAAIVQIHQFDAFFRIVDEAGASTVYGTPLAHHREAIEEAFEVADGRPVVVIADDDPDAPLSRVAPALATEPVELQRTGQIVLGQEESLYVVTPSTDPFVAEILSRIGHIARPPVPLPGSEHAYSYYFAAAPTPAGAVEPIARFANGLTLLGSEFPKTLLPGESIATLLWWQVTEPLTRDDLVVFTHLLDHDENLVAGHDLPAPRNADLRPGDQIVTWVTIDLPPTGPGLYRLSVGLYRSADLRRVPVVEASVSAGKDTVQLGPVKLALPKLTPPSELVAVFGETIGLESASVATHGSPASVQSVRAAETIDVRLVWRALGAPDRDYTVFVHVVDAQGNLIAQHDGQPRHSSYPTAIWDRGEQIVDVHPVTLPGELPAGSLRVVVGLYDGETLDRLPRSDASGDTAEVGRLDVAP